MKLKDRVAIVTGGGRNIGKAIVLALAREGADIVIADIDMEAAERTSQEVREISRRSIFVKTDITKIEDIKILVGKTIEEFGKIDILVNNAGVQLNKQRLENLTEREWDITFNVNVKGTVFLSQAVAEKMKLNGGGKVIIISSICAFVFTVDNLAYNVSKATLKALTSQLAMDLAEYNINVNGIAPGFIDTSFNEETLSVEGARERIASTIPLKRLGKSEDLSEAAVFLASDASSYMTGQTIIIDGGFILP